MSVSTLYLMTSHCSLNMLVCVPEISIIMPKSVSLKIAKNVLNMPKSTDRNFGVSIVSQLEGAPVCTHFLLKYECFPGAG